MARTVEQISGSLYKISSDGKDFLATHISSARHNRSAKQFAEEGLSPGYIVRGREVTQWRPAGFIEHEGEIYLYGEYYEGRRLSSVLTGSAQNILFYLQQLVGTFSVLTAEGVKIPPFHIDGYLILNDGGILVFPPSIIERLRNTQAEAERIETSEIFNHPEMEGESALSFTIGVVVYRMMTGEFPFTAENSEELHDKMREFQVVPPRYRIPDIKQSASKMVSDAIDTKEKKPTLSEWAEVLEQWRKDGYTESIAEDKKERIVEQGEKIARRNRTKFARKSFFRQHGRTIVIVAIAVVVVGSVLGSILRNKLQPRVTRGFEPREVVELFYSSINEFDHQAMEDCVAKSVAKGPIREATNLFVLTRMRLGNEGTTGIVDAQKWKQGGMDPVPDAHSVYGVADLVLNEESENVFIAEYEKWEQVAEETLGYLVPGSGSVLYERRDRLTLEFDGTYWLIVEYEQLESELTDG